jgi:hypothetical protein
MRRRPTQTTQIAVRVDTELVRQLETRAKERRISLSEEIRARIVDSFKPEPSLADVKPEPSLAEFRTYWLRRVRDIIENNARKTTEKAKKIEDAWRALQQLDAKFTLFYTEAEKELDSYLSDPGVQELLRGAPTLPDETKSKQS